MNTLNNILKQETKTFLSEIDHDNIPTPDDIERELLDRIGNALELENALLPNRRKWSIPKVLDNAVIADIILALTPVKRLLWSGTDSNNNYDLVVYQPDGKDAGLYTSNLNVFKNLIRCYNYNISEKSIDEVISILSSKAPICRLNDDPDLIAVNNGIFNYKTKQLLPFSPDIVFTSKSRVNYNPKATNPIIHNKDDNTIWDIESWMNDLSDDPQIVELLWQVIGAIIRPNVSWNQVICFYSETGNNGKGTLCHLMRNICGKNSCAALSFASFAHEFMLEELTHVSAVIADENPTKSFTKEVSALKAVITGDYLTINRKYKMPITIRFKGLIVQCINDLPKFGDKSESLYRRFKLIPFDKCFTGCERKYIKDDYLNRDDVLEYVLFKVLNTSYYEFINADACESLLNEYKSFNDPVRQFLNDILPELAWSLVPYTFLYSLYKSWFKNDCPSGQIQSKSSFIKDVKNILLNNEEWSAKDTPVKRRNLMDSPEPLIVKYDLTDWKNDNYTGNDINMICKPVLKEQYRGLRRIDSNND